MTGRRSDVDRALDAIQRLCGDEYDCIWADHGEWGAHRKGAPADEVLAAATAGELDRADLAARSAQ